LLKEVKRGTRVDFAFSRCAVVFWAAFDRISNEEIAAVHPAPGQHLIQKAPGRTDERLATLVFITAWGFTNEHHACRWRTLPRHSLGPRGMQRTLHTTADLYG
jgi:hypothetical protein